MDSLREFLASEEFLGILGLIVTGAIGWCGTIVRKRFGNESAISTVSEFALAAVQQSYDKIVAPAKASGIWGADSKEAARTAALNFLKEELPKDALKLATKMGDDWLKNKINKAVIESK